MPNMHSLYDQQENSHVIWNFLQEESGKVILEETEFDLGRELEGLIDMFSVQCINHNVETVLDLSGMISTFII